MTLEEAIRELEEDFQLDEKATIAYQWPPKPTSSDVHYHLSDIHRKLEDIKDVVNPEDSATLARISSIVGSLSTRYKTHRQAEAIEEDYPPTAPPGQGQAKASFKNELQNLIKRNMRKLKPEVLASVLELAASFARELL